MPQSRSCSGTSRHLFQVDGWLCSDSVSCEDCATAHIKSGCSSPLGPIYDDVTDSWLCSDDAGFNQAYIHQGCHRAIWEDDQQAWVCSDGQGCDGHDCDVATIHESCSPPLTVVWVDSIGRWQCSDEPWAAADAVANQFRNRGVLLRNNDNTRPHFARFNGSEDIAETPNFATPYPTTLLHHSTPPVIWYDQLWAAGNIVGQGVLVGFVFNEQVHDRVRCGFPLDGNSEVRRGSDNRCGEANYAASADWNRLEPSLSGVDSILSRREEIFRQIKNGDLGSDEEVSHGFSTGMEIELEVAPAARDAFQLSDVLALVAVYPDNDEVHISEQEVRENALKQNEHAWIEGLDQHAVDMLPIVAIRNVPLTLTWAGYKTYYDNYDREAQIFRDFFASATR